MYTTILVAAALQDWERYSTHALAAREVAATLAKGASHHLHIGSSPCLRPAYRIDSRCLKAVIDTCRIPRKTLENTLTRRRNPAHGCL